MKYSKPSLSIQDQLALLKARDLIVPDNQRGKRYLTFIGYYRLSVYFLPFQNNKDKFDSGTKFDNILNLYIFDRKLKLLVLDAIERIEIAAKAVISNYMSQKFQLTSKPLEDLLRSVVDCRNLCAHHERFWNSSSKHSISKKSTKLIANGFSENNRATYFQLYIIDTLMQKITTKSSFVDEESFNKYKPKSFEALMSGFQEYKD